MISKWQPKSPAQRITVDEYDRMIADGTFAEDDRVELIHGEIVPKMPIGDSHSACVDRLNFRFNLAVAGRALVRVQNPVILTDSEPEPDVSLAHFRPDFYQTGRPRPADVLLIIEVADSTPDRDRDVKGPLYANNGIPEYWIVDLNTDTVLVYRGPQPDGTWAITETRRRGDTLTITALPGVAVAVADILP
jgi:Uma2 family endonuclease